MLRSPVKTLFSMTLLTGDVLEIVAPVVGSVDTSHTYEVSLQAGTHGWCSPRHRVTFATRVKSALDDVDIARQAIGCHVAQEPRVRNAFDDVANTIHQSS